MKIKILLAASILLAACGDDGSSATNSVNTPESSSEVELSSSSIVNDDEFSSSSTIVPESSFSDVESSSSIVESSSSTSLSSSSNSDVEANTFIDKRDGRKYRTVTIGTQTWFAENLAYDLKASKGYDAFECPNDEVENCELYGNVYDQWAFLDKYEGPIYFPAVPESERPFKGLCPTGWHLPSISEWQTLLDNVYVQDLVTKSAGGTGESGFDVYLVGGLSLTGVIYYGEAGLFASVDEVDDLYMVTVKITPTSVTTQTKHHSFFVSVRCVKD